MVANAVDVIVHIARSKNGKRKVTEISELTGEVVDGLPEIIARTVNSNLLKVS
jgi:Flp pilus assembly CpaF family ATPase